MSEPGQETRSDVIAGELRLVVGRVARRLRQGHAVGELTLSEVSVLARLEREGAATSGALAELERVRPQAMGSTLTALAERGLVARTPDSGDARRVLVTVTEAGRELVLGRRSASNRRLAAALDEQLSAEERERLLAVLPLLDRVAAHL